MSLLRRWNSLALATVIAVGFIAFLLFVSYGPAAASELRQYSLNHGYAPAGNHGYVGTIQSATTTSFALATKKGAVVTITVDSATKFRVPGVKGATFADFQVGDMVAVLARPVSGVPVARHVNLIPGKPGAVHRAGTIQSYQAGSSVTLVDKKGQTSTFVVTGDTQIEFKKGATQVSVGLRAVVIARRDPATDQFTARTIVVFGP